MLWNFGRACYHLRWKIELPKYTWKYPLGAILIVFEVPARLLLCCFLAQVRNSGCPREDWWWVQVVWKGKALFMFRFWREWGKKWRRFPFWSLLRRFRGGLSSYGLYEHVWFRLIWACRRCRLVFSRTWWKCDRRDSWWVFWVCSRRVVRGWDEYWGHWRYLERGYDLQGWVWEWKMFVWSRSSTCDWAVSWRTYSINLYCLVTIYIIPNLLTCLKGLSPSSLQMDQ